MSDDERERPPDDVLRDAIEAVVFASPEPVHPREIAEAFGEPDEDRIERALEELVEHRARSGGGLFVEQVAGGYRFATRPHVGAWVRQFFRQRNRTRLTPATLEGLAIVAYRQPITAPEIQAVRGKDPTYALKVLLEKKLIRILGRKKVVGNPLLYGTTKRFLEHFGLNSLSDLPSIEEFDSFLGALGGEQGTLFGDPATSADGGLRENDLEPLDDVDDLPSLAGGAADRGPDLETPGAEAAVDVDGDGVDPERVENDHEIVPEV